ncbi:PsbP-related protein [Chloroflexota bacterium]
MKKHKWQWSLIGVSLLLLLSLVPGCVTVVSPDQTAQPSGFLTYTDTTNGFSISYPSDWERVSQEFLTQGEYVAFWALKLGNGMPPYLSVLESDLTPGTSLEAFFEEEKAIAEAHPGYTFISKEKVVVNGIPGIKLVSTLVEADTPAKVMQLLLVHGNSSWVITCLCAPGLYGNYESTFDSIINSFQISGASTTAPSPTSSGFTPYTDTTNSFSISYPSDWEPVPQELISDSVIFGVRKLGTTRAIVLVNKSFLPNVGTLETAYEEIRLVHEAEPGYIFISKDHLTIDGIPAFKYVFQVSFDGTPATVVYVYLVQGNVDWLIQLSCVPPQSYTQYQPTFDAIIGSFDIY